MANKEHLARLKQGVDVWNRWRAADRDIHPDLTAADLSDANLTRVNLFMANLIGANFTGANLIMANLSEADLTGAGLYKATIGWTRFGNVDLNTVQWVDTIHHMAPSTIGIDTLYRSNGNISEAFLRGAGVPEDIITYMKSLVVSPFKFYSCFISYSSKDQEFVERLHADLQSKGVRCWFAPKDLRIGEKFRTSIDEAIRLRDKLLLVLSTHSIRSQWVEKEVETAFEEEHRRKKTIVFPIQLDNSVMKTRRAWAADIR